MKKLLIVVLLIFLASGAYAADTAINARAELNEAPAEGDILPFYDVSASAGKRVTIINTMRALESALTNFAIHADNLPDLSSIYQTYDADLTTYASITPSSDVQSMLAASNDSAILSSIGAEEDSHAGEHAVGAADTIFPVDPNADRYLKWNDTGSALEWDSPIGSGDVTGVGDCADGDCLDGSDDGGTYIRIYDSDSHYLEINPGDLSANRTIAFRDAGGTALLSGDTLTGDVTATFDTDGSTATAIGAGVINEPDLDADNSPVDGDVLTYDETGTNFNWITPAAGTDITADLEEESHASEHQDGAADEIAVTAGMMNTGTNASSSTFWRGDNTWASPTGSGDVTGVGDCTDGDCLDGSEDGGTYIRLYDGDTNYLQLDPGDLAANRTIDFRDAAGTVLLSGDTLTGDVTATFDTDGSTETSIASNVIIEPDLNADNSPSDGDILTYDSTGTNFAWITQHAGTDITADLEEEVTAGSLADDTITEAELKAVNAAEDEDILTYETTTGDFEWHTAAELGIGVATSITDGIIVEADLSATNAPTDNYVLTYNAAGSNFTWEADQTGATTAYDDIGDPDASGSIAFGAYTGTYTSATDGWGGMLIDNTTSDLASETILLSLRYYDAQGDSEMTYLKMIADADGTPIIEFVFDDDGLKIGNGSPTQTMNGEDLYVEGFLEVDGAIYADGGIISSAADDPYIYFDSSTANESKWAVGTNHDSQGDDDDNLEFRQSTSPGTSVEMYLTPSGLLGLTGGLTIGSTITMQNSETIANSTDTQIVFAADGGESLIFDLDTATDNQVEISTGSSANEISINSGMRLVAAGVDAGAPVYWSTAATVTVAGYSATYFNGDADVIEFDLPADPAVTINGIVHGKVFCFRNMYNNAMTIDPNGTDIITLGGTDASAGEAIISTGSDDEFMCLIGIGASNWVTMGYYGTWAEETP